MLLFRYKTVPPAALSDTTAARAASPLDGRRGSAQGGAGLALPPLEVAGGPFGLGLLLGLLCGRLLLRIRVEERALAALEPVGDDRVSAVCMCYALRTNVGWTHWVYISQQRLVALNFSST